MAPAHLSNCQLTGSVFSMLGGPSPKTVSTGVLCYNFSVIDMQNDPKNISNNVYPEMSRFDICQNGSFHDGCSHIVQKLQKSCFEVVVFLPKYFIHETSFHLRCPGVTSRLSSFGWLARWWTAWNGQELDRAFGIPNTAWNLGRTWKVIQNAFSEKKSKSLQ